jgi:hypothetical protein
MRADECKCKFHASLAASELDFVLLNYIAFASRPNFLHALNCYEIKSMQKKQVCAELSFLLASLAGGIIHTAKLDVGRWGG